MEIKKQEMLKQKEGITLIALTVTIVVLIILASISIGVLGGEDGLINQAKLAKEETEISEEKELLGRATVQVAGKDVYGNIEEEALQKELDKEAGEGKTEVTDTGEEFEVIFKEKNRYYIVDKEGNVGEVQEIIEDKNPGDITKDKDGNELDGSEEHPFEIWCIEDLIEWSQNYDKYKYSVIKLCKNLNFKSKLSYNNSERTDYGDINQDGNVDIIIEELQSKEGFNPIQEFAGTFDGNNNRINNLYISKQNDAGFINYLDNGVFKNVIINGHIYSGNEYCGIISKAYISTIENLISDTKMYGSTGAGIIGKCIGKINITNVKNLGDIEAKSAVGGICGDQFSGEILNCINQGTIKSSASSNYGVGGFCGNNTENAIIKNCINIGTIIYDGKKSSWYFGGTGGIIGLNRSTLTIQNCVNMGEIQSTSYIGAICGCDLEYWQNKEIYELTNSFILNNVDKITGSNEVEMPITIFEREMIQNVITSLNKYIEENKLIEEGWKFWTLGKDEYPVFE